MFNYAYVHIHSLKPQQIQTHADFASFFIGVTNSNQTESRVVSISEIANKINDDIITAISNLFDSLGFSLGNATVNETFESKIENKNIFSFTNTATGLSTFNLSCNLIRIDEHTILSTGDEQVINTIFQDENSLSQLATFMTKEFNQTLGKECQVTFVCNDIDNKFCGVMSTANLGITSTTHMPSITANSTLIFSSSETDNSNSSNTGSPTVTDDGGDGSNVKARVS